MEKILSDSGVQRDGVTFEVAVENLCRECVVTKEALAHLRIMHGLSMELTDIYRAFEARIQSVARRLVIAGEKASPLVLGPQVFH